MSARHERIDHHGVDQHGVEHHCVDQHLPPSEGRLPFDRRKGWLGPLAFAECMRANGVSNFPDPSATGPLFNTAGVVTSSPAFRAAQAKCQKLMGGGPPGPGSTTHPSERTLAKLRRTAVCMRGHGVPQFPDPRTSVPPNPTGYQEITNFDGVILLFPVSMDLQAPAYKHALTACGAPPLGLPH